MLDLQAAAKRSTGMDSRDESQVESLVLQGLEDMSPPYALPDLSIWGDVEAHGSPGTGVAESSREAETGVQPSHEEYEGGLRGTEASNENECGTGDEEPGNLVRQTYERRHG